MSLEVELKAPCPKAIERAKAIGARHIRDLQQKDTYYTHPCRDLKKNDEALRLRDEGVLKITYKGPRISHKMKARTEIEFQVGEKAYQLLESLGFSKAHTIRKKRSIFDYNGLIICCDKVEGLGEYVEVEGSSHEDYEMIIDALKKLGVADEATTKSYSELLGL